MIQIQSLSILNNRFILLFGRWLNYLLLLLTRFVPIYRYITIVQRIFLFYSAYWCFLESVFELYDFRTLFEYKQIVP